MTPTEKDDLRKRVGEEVLAIPGFDPDYHMLHEGTVMDALEKKGLAVEYNGPGVPRDLGTTTEHHVWVYLKEEDERMYVGKARSESRREAFFRAALEAVEGDEDG